MPTSTVPPGQSSRADFLRASDVLDTPAEPAFDAATELAARICATPIATVTLLDELRQWFKSSVGLTLTETPIEIAFCAHTAASSGFLMVPDAALDPRFADNPLVVGEPYIRFYAGTPLIIRGDLPLGTVAVMDTRPRTLSEDQKEMLESLGRQVASALEQRHELAEQKRKIVEHADSILRTTEARYEAIVEASPDLICRFKPDTTLTFVNEAYCRAFGRSRESLIGTPITALVPEEDRAMVAAGLASLTPEMAPRTHTELAVLPDGQRRWFQWTDIPVRDAEGQFLEYQGVGRDVTNLRESESALRESEQRFRQLAESISEVFYLASPGSERMLYVSPAYERIWGRRRSALYEQPWDWLNAVHPDDRERVRRAATQEASGKYDLEYRLLLENGEVRWIRDRAIRVLDDLGEVIRVAGVAEDITARRGLEEQVRRTQKLESIGQLAAGVAHDFNNLLTVIQGNVSLLQERFGVEGEPGEPGQLLAHVAAAAERGAALTRQLLLFSRKEHMQRRLVNVSRQCRHMAGLLERGLGEDVEFELDLAEHLPAVYADPGMIDQVITNLTLNARDAMPKGGRLRIETRTCQISWPEAERVPEARPGTFVRLSVSDTGAGIPPAHLHQVFEPFFTTKEAGRGTGLGLSTAYGIVAQHGGWIDLESEAGQGTTVHVHLPPAEAGAERTTRMPAADLPGGTETVLLVEDEPGLRDLADRVLSGRGYRVLSASSGPQGLELWRSRADEVDLLLTDILLPGGMRGHELALRCREDRPELKVLYMSGYRGDLPEDSLDEGPSSDFLPKPFRPSQLLAAVRALLDRAQQHT